MAWPLGVEKALAALPRVRRLNTRLIAATTSRQQTPLPPFPKRTDHTLQATALVHEAWSRLAQDESGRWREPGEFFAIATRVMEQVLVDHARRHASMKRGAGRTKLGAGLDGRGATLGAGDDGTDYVEMHRALCELERADPRAAALVRLRFFAGLTARQAAEVLGISLPAADGEWRATRAWLSARLRRHLAADIS